MIKYSKLFVFLFMKIVSFGQITFENSYSQFVNFGLLKLEFSGYKYFSVGSNINLYNLDHSLFKQLSLPNLPSGSSNVKVGFITEALFDSDSTNIEYLLTYDNGFGLLATYFTRVCREDGSVLFAKDSATGVTTTPGFIQYFGPVNATIYNTDQGAKMFLSSGIFDNSVSVYSLPGMLPCIYCDGQRSTPLQTSNDFYNNFFKVYPNPTDTYTLVEYELVSGIDKGVLVIYDVQGKEIVRYDVDKQNRQLLVPTSNFKSGSYYCILEQSGKVISGKIVISR